MCAGADCSSRQNSRSATAPSASGKALDEVFPGTSAYKPVNVLNKIPSFVQSGMRKTLQDNF